MNEGICCVKIIGKVIVALKLFLWIIWSEKFLFEFPSFTRWGLVFWRKWDVMGSNRNNRAPETSRQVMFGVCWIYMFELYWYPFEIRQKMLKIVCVRCRSYGNFHLNRSEEFFSQHQHGCERSGSQGNFSTSGLSANKSVLSFSDDTWQAYPSFVFGHRGAPSAPAAPYTVCFTCLFGCFVCLFVCLSYSVTE